MNISLVNFATKEYESKKKQNTFSAKYFGRFDKVFSFSPEDIEHYFIEQNKDILSQKRGAGLWLWKPYFFNKVLNENINYGEFLFHCDAASFFIKSVRPLIKQMQRDNIDVMCFSLPLAEKEWTSPYVLNYFNIEDDMKNSNQVLANFLVIKKTTNTIKFAREWLDLCCNNKLLSGNILENQNLPNYFKQHRFDQSILSLLCKKYNIKPYRDPSQYGIYPEMYRNNGNLIKTNFRLSNYKTTIILIRKSSLLKELIKLIKIFIKKK